MESANLRHQHQLPDQLVGSPPLPLGIGAAPSCYGFGSSSNHHHAWSSSPTTSSIFNNNFGNTNPNYDGMVSSKSTIITTRPVKSRVDHDNNINPVSHDNIISLNSSNMVNVEFEFPWTNCNSTTTTITHESAYDMNLAAKIEEESESISFPKFAEILNSCTSTTSTTTSATTTSSTTTSPSNSISNVNDDYGHFFLKRRDLITTSGRNGTDENLLVKTLSSSTGQVVNVGNQISSATSDQFDSNIMNGTFGGLMAVGCRGQFSQIYPSINISNFNQSSPSSNISVTCSLDINSIGPHQSLNDMNNLDVFREIPSNNFCGLLRLDQMHLPQRLSSGHSKGPSFINSEITVAKRGGGLIEPKTTQSAPNKKPKMESRTSCPPFKVRKEKLGDRIATLQQLVSPFGKTDTASVLMEAIGYIKFLQNQVETLSVPYMKSSRNKITKTTQRGVKEDGSESELKGDLRSRGLCLVPLSCMSYVTGDGGGGSMWPPANYGGRT
ncbi:transcription factor bHLH110 isoform X2 [Humulus lupulus]|uniref:transcription factor bHLH110 isoform X2 n=1 Tax=Humulus lupulus TaxID=3486 RepID=UPI002B417C92|nr:transcription factor bHLH110 isoform X2 [Humulus lupulus]